MSSPLIGNHYKLLHLSKYSKANCVSQIAVVGGNHIQKFSDKS